MAWCDQCDRRRHAAEIAACGSRFCPLRPKPAPPPAPPPVSGLGGMFSHRTSKPQGVAFRQRAKASGPRKSKPGATMADRFAEAIAEIGDVAATSDALGISRIRGNSIFQNIRKDINRAQRAAGYGDWAV